MSPSEQLKTIVAALQAKGNPFEVAEVPWLAKLEEDFSHQFPVLFRELIANFRFPEFDLAGVTVFSNLNDGSDSDITVAPFADRFMSSWLKSHHFIQFGRPSTGSYDPVCFDLAEGTHNVPVVMLQHEDILLERKSVRVEQLAPSFLALVNAEFNG